MHNNAVVSLYAHCLLLGVNDGGGGRRTGPPPEDGVESVVVVSSRFVVSGRSVGFLAERRGMDIEKV